MADTCFVYRDGKIQEIHKSQLDRRSSARKLQAAEISRLDSWHAIPEASYLAHEAIENHKSGKRPLQGRDRQNIKEI